VPLRPPLPLALPALLALAAACGGSASGSSPSEPAPPGPIPYLTDAAFRRADLVASLVNPSDGYATLRLSHYDTGNASDWSLLPEWNPATEPIAASELDAPGGASPTSLSSSASPLALPASVTSLDDPALLALGEAAFSRYPVQLTPYFEVALASRDAASQYGMWVDDTRGVGGLVRARMGDGSVALSETCSTCHASRDGSGAFVVGRPNSGLRVGASVLAAEGSTLEPGVAAAIALWGPGRLDVTTDTGVEPARIPDLRPIPWLTYLQQDATLQKRDLTTLAIRIETLIITSNEEVVRPPRLVSLALAVYLTSLGAELPSQTTAAAASPHGASVFASTCTGCHQGEGMTGDPVPLAVVGTNPTLGDSPSRGTGNYRVPSLRGVGTRGPLLHDGTVPSVADMLDPARVTPAYTGNLHGSGAVPGHTFGLDLPDADRAALVTYLNAL
jgi:cytochrome c5